MRVNQVSEVKGFFGLGSVMKRYKCNDDFFSLDNELSFYWAGFMAADGWVIKRGQNKKLAIEISNKDIEHIKLFKKHIDFCGNIFNTKRGAVRVIISSSKNYDSLRRFGVVERKTKIYKMSDFMLNHKYINHFLRGYFDGDGGFVTDYRGKTEKVTFSLRGTKRFLEQVLTIFRKNSIFDYDKNISFDITYRISFSGNVLCAKIRDFLYKDCTVYLDRKYRIVNKPYVNIINKSYKSIKGTNIKTGEILVFSKIEDTKSFGFTRDSVGRACNNKFASKRNIYKEYMWEFDK